jgi:hypothetical protein
MNRHVPDRQLVLFPREQVAWETLTDECQHALSQLLSLLLEQVHNQQQQQAQSTTPVKENPHV